MDCSQSAEQGTMMSILGHPEDMPRTMRTGVERESRVESHLPGSDMAKGTLEEVRQGTGSCAAAGSAVNSVGKWMLSSLSPEEEPSRPSFVLRTKSPQFHECPNELPRAWAGRSKRGCLF